MNKENTPSFDRTFYQGSPSTLCTGCGHDSITQHIISALFLSQISPYKVAKVSGIGCSSKTPAYFLKHSHGFNSLHGRMAPLAIGAKLANTSLKVLGVSGDGDSASIGLGGFVHLMRRNLPMVYIVENNGVYGLTKGQFSATAEKESTLKSGFSNLYENIDLCALAIESGCSFVARSFSGDAKQLIPILKAAFEFDGTAFIDIISPCVTFANHDGSTKSYNYIKEHKFSLYELNFVPAEEEVLIDYNEGEIKNVNLSNGSHLLFRKLDSKSYDPLNKKEALLELHKAQEEKQILTGLIYLNPRSQNLIEKNNLVETPLTVLNEEESRIKREDFENLLNSFS